MSAIRTTHVGSLPRSQPVVDFLFARERGESYDEHGFRECMTRAVNATVERQRAIGIDVVSDGETSKISYATYVKDRYSGFSGDNPRSAPADLKQFPGYLQRLADAGGTPQYSRPGCTGAVTALSDADLTCDIDNLVSAMAAHKVAHGFMNAASPGVISLFLPNQYYDTREHYLQALAQAMQAEYEAIVGAGLLLQLDCPDLGLSRHMMFADLTDAEYVDIANQHVEVLNQALANIPSDKVRIHICWGNYEGPHICDIEMKAIFDTLMRVDADYLLFEASNPRHAHEWQLFAERKNDIPDDKILVPGVVDTTTNFVEHPQLVAERINRFTNIVGRERVIAGTDCGFGTFAGFGAVDPDIAFAKLGALVAGAKAA